MNLFTTKGNMMLTTRAYRFLAAGLILLSSAAAAQTSNPNTTDAALIERVKEAVIKELRESGALDREIDAGIERYVKRQHAEAAERERRAAASHTAALRPVSSNDHIRGNPAAPVTLIEYSDFECPYCKNFHGTLRKLVEDSKGKVRWVYRHFPLDQLHSKARKEAAASECAAELGGNAAFWKFADRLFELSRSNNRTDIDKVLPQVAHETGLDMAKFKSCLASGRHDKRVEEDLQNAMATGGNGTPWSLIVSKSGKVHPLSGARPYPAVKQLVDLALEDK